jgi:hypothetical protein
MVIPTGLRIIAAKSTNTFKSKKSVHSSYKTYPMKPSCYLLFLWFVANGLTASAQTDSSAFLSRAVSSLAKQPATEKVYLHLDKPNYFFGDTIWYKAYTVIGAHHQLSALSGVLYVELISPKDSILSRQKLRLVSGIGWGDFALPHSYKQGSYHIRAYTNWMRNAGPDYFYNQRVQIGGLQSLLMQGKQIIASNHDLQFFPEGGQLVNGVRSRVAVKAVNANGLGEDIKGTIADNDGNVVADFATQHLGMGVFAFIPQSGKTYKAKIDGPGEAGFNTDLPKAQDEGFTLALNNSQPDSIFVKVAVNDNTFNQQKNSTFYIAAQSGGKIYYASKGKLDGLIYAAKVEKSRFPSGIVQFTLFSQNGEPVAERIAFIQNADTLKLNIASPAASYATRQNVKLSLQANDQNNNPITGSFSVAVINESRTGLDETAESTIMNNLLLTSDLKGYIEQPNYYFINVNDETKANLDILMLTQGYRRFEWKQVLDNPNPVITYQPERSLELSGTLKTPAGKVVPNGKITLAAMHANLLIDTVTDADGNFKFTNLNLPDTTEIVLRARKQHNGSNVAIYVKQQDYPAVLKSRINTDTAGRLTPEMVKNLADYQAMLKQDSLKNGQQLKEVVIKDKPIAKPDVYNHYGTSLEYDADMKRLNKEFVNIKDGLALLIPGASYVNGKIMYENHPVMLVIDGFKHGADDLDLYSPGELDNIRMISETFTTPATLMINTKRYEGTDTTATVLKQVTIRDKRVVKPGISNRYGADLPYTISGDKLRQYGSLVQGLQVTLPLALYVNGKFIASQIPYKNILLHVVINDKLTDQSELDRISPDEVEDVKILEGGAYKTLYGITGNWNQNLGVGIFNKDGDDYIIYVTTKQYAGTDTAKTINLKTVNIRSNKAPKAPELTNSDNLNGPGNADQVIMGDKVEGCITLSDCLNGKVFGVTFKNGVPYSIRGQNRLNGSLPMVVIVDGNIMTGNHLDDINASDINSIEVLRSGAFLAVYGSNAPGGALVITTKRGGGNSYVTSETPAGLITYPIKGFYIARTFYSPKYNGPKSNLQRPDMRSTIYWEPNIITDKDGKATFEYFNADTKGTYRVVVEGIDDYGDLGRQVYRYKVE